MTRATSVLEVDGVSPDEVAFAPHCPDLVQEAVSKSLAPRAAAKNYEVAAEKPGAGTEFHARFAAQPGAVEEDRLGRQEFENGAAAGRQGLADGRYRAGRAVDLLGCRCCDMRYGARCEPDGNR